MMGNTIAPVRSWFLRTGFLCLWFRHRRTINPVPPFCGSIAALFQVLLQGVNNALSRCRVVIFDVSPQPIAQRQRNAGCYPSSEGRLIGPGARRGVISLHGASSFPWCCPTQNSTTMDAAQEGRREKARKKAPQSRSDGGGWGITPPMPSETLSEAVRGPQNKIRPPAPPRSVRAVTIRARGPPARCAAVPPAPGQL